MRDCGLEDSRLEGGLVANATTRRQHPNAPLTPEGRRRMVRCVTDRGWTVEATAERFQVDAKTVRKWRDRWLVAGDDGLRDRSSRPHRSPNRTRRQLRRKVCRIRKKRRWGADHIAFEVDLAASTVQNILNQAGLGRLDRGDRATNRESVKRYQRDTPGELIHVDIKKIAGIPDGGGWRTRGRGYKGGGATSRRVGYRYIHTALDDRSRITYSEILDDEQGATAAGFWQHSGSCRSGSTRNGSSPTTAPATDHATGTRPVTRPARRSRRPDRTGPRPTARSNASTGSCSKNGPTSDPGDQRPNEPTPMTGSSTSTITTEPTERSDGPPPSASSRTTSPKSTPSRRPSDPASFSSYPLAGGGPKGRRGAKSSIPRPANAIHVPPAEGRGDARSLRRTGGSLPVPVDGADPYDTRRGATTPNQTTPTIPTARAAP